MSQKSHGILNFLFSENDNYRARFSYLTLWSSSVLLFAMFKIKSWTKRETERESNVQNSLFYNEKFNFQGTLLSRPPCTRIKFSKQSEKKIILPDVDTYVITLQRALTASKREMSVVPESVTEKGQTLRTWEVKTAPIGTFRGEAIEDKSRPGSQLSVTDTQDYHKFVHKLYIVCMCAYNNWSALSSSIRKIYSGVTFSR